MDKILVTGVAGFLGSNLASYLLKNENNIVFGVDNFSSSTMSNLYPLLKNDRFHFIEQNLINPIEVNVDFIYHLAGCGDFRRYFDNKFNFMIEQIEIIKNIINFTILNGAKLVLTTQNCSYEQHNSDYFKYYDTLKIIESLILELVDSNKISAIFARLNYVYGENMSQNDSRFIPKSIISAALQKDIIEEYDESFYFTYVGDVVKNLTKLMNNYCENPIMDIYNQNLYLKSDIIKLIISYLKSSSKFKLKTIEQYNPSYKPENFILNNGIELTCKTPVLEGVLKTIQYFKLMYFS